MSLRHDSSLRKTLHPLAHHDGNDLHHLMRATHNDTQLILRSLEDLKAGINTFHSDFRSATPALAKPSTQPKPSNSTATEEITKDTANTLQQSQILERENLQLISTANTLERQKQENLERISRLEKSVQNLHQQNSKIQDETKQLKQMMLSHNEDKNEPTDSEVIREFTSLRSKLQSIIFNIKLPHLEKVHFSPVESPKASSRTLEFYEQEFYGAPNDKSRKLRLRARIFRDMKLALFDTPCFGASSKLESALRKFDASLRKIENVHGQAVSEWQRHTMRCVELLGENTGDQRLVEDVAFSLLDYLLPLLPEDQSKDEKTKTELKDLCTKAHRLAIRLRQSRSRYEVTAVEHGRKLGVEEGEEFTVVDSEEENAKMLAAYTLFGALTKYDFGYGKRIVLERAEVIA